MAGIRRYRVRYTEEKDGSYTTRYKELRSLREAGEFIQQVSRQESLSFSQIQAVDYGSLTEQEMTMLDYFSDGALKKSKKSLDAPLQKK